MYIVYFNVIIVYMIRHSSSDPHSSGQNEAWSFQKEACTRYSLYVFICLHFTTLT